MPRVGNPRAALDGSHAPQARFAPREVSAPTRAAAGCGCTFWERLNGKSGADSSKAGAAPATVIEFRRITQSHCARQRCGKAIHRGVTLQLESPETGLER